ncbi:unnamed protein product [Protopolystoma xenopodis]|uniref:Uncharacterized protein n=1 Tax=Protopolystoma xenopodis TaxID=117903 RepID=A0A448XDN4_9PLAT|nr:unnamed protein product [Protopolystoma xenopodis]
MMLLAPTVSHFDDAIIGLQNTWDAPLQISTDKQLQLASSATAPSFSTAVSPSHHLHNSRISHISSEDKLDEVCPPGDVPLPETAHFDANGSGDGSSSSTNWSYCIPIAIYARLTDPEVSRIVFRWAK